MRTRSKRAKASGLDEASRPLLQQRLLRRTHILTSVSAVTSSRAAVAALPHVTSKIDSYAACIDPQWTMEWASDRGFVHLLDRLGSQEWTGVSDKFREARFKQAINRAIVGERLDALRWWMTEYMPGNDAAVVEAALGPDAKRARVLQWLFEQGKLPLDHPNWTRNEICYAPDVAYWVSDHAQSVPMTLGVDSGSDFAFVQWAHEQQTNGKYGLVGMRSVLDRTSRSGDMAILLWIHANRTERCSKEALGYAVSGGHTKMAHWLYTNYPEQHFEDPWEAPCDLDLIQWTANDYKWKATKCRSRWIDNSILNVIKRNPDQAALGSVLNILEFLYSSEPQATGSANNRSRPPPTQAMDVAAHVGNLPIVQWLHTNQRGGCTVAAMDEAAAMGHLNIVKWLHENRSEGCTAKAMENAIKNGHLEMVQWLHCNKPQDCPRAMDIAAGRGHFELLKWLHCNRSNDCTHGAIAKAARGGYFEIAKWLQENRTEGWSTQAIDFAAYIGRLDIIEYLQSCCTTSCSHLAFENAAKGGHIKVMKWLVDHALVNPAHVMAVSENPQAFIENLTSVKFIIAYCKVKYNDSVIALAARLNRFGIIEWLLRYANENGDLNTKCPFSGY